MNRLSERCEDHRELRQDWATAEELGLPYSEDEKIWQLVHEEVFERATPHEALAIANATGRWLESENAHFLDLALMMCHEIGIEIPPTLLEQLARAATIRLNDRERGGTAAQVVKEYAHSEAHRLMGNLRAAGLTLEGAGSKAARYLAALGVKKLKASYLQQTYKKSNWCKLEDKLRRTHAKYGFSEAWTHLAKELPDADEDLTGTRR